MSKLLIAISLVGLLLSAASCSEAGSMESFIAEANKNLPVDFGGGNSFDSITSEDNSLVMVYTMNLPNAKDQDIVALKKNPASLKSSLISRSKRNLQIVEFCMSNNVNIINRVKINDTPAFDITITPTDLR